VNDLHRSTAEDADLIAEAVSRVVGSAWFALGPEVEAFEASFAAYVGAGRCIGVGNGTDALEISLRAVGVGPGSAVATVANAGFYSAAACLAIGARPVYCDVDPLNASMSTADLDALLGAGVDAVVFTHLYGEMGHIELVAEACARAGVPLVEDCAQAVGAVLDGRPAGSWGDAAAFSFYPTKNLGALGDGGAIVTSRPEVAQRALELRQYGWSAKYVVEHLGGRNSRLDALQAAVLRARLVKLAGRNERRRQIASAVAKTAAEHGVQTLFNDGPQNVAHHCVLVVPDRDAFRDRLHEDSVGTDVHYPVPDHQQPVLRNTATWEPLPVTEQLTRHIVSVPCYPELSDAEVERVCAAVDSALRGQG
jgi:aminotransferase EvaB